MFLAIEAEDGTVAVTLPLAMGETIIGSSRDCGIVLSEVGLSRKHLCLRSTSDEIVFEDLSSTTGTFYDGEQVTKGKLLPGQRLRVGSVYLRLVKRPISARQERSVFAHQSPLAQKSSTVSKDATAFGHFIELLRSASDPKELLERLLQGLLDALQAERGYVLLAQGKSATLVPVAVHAPEDDDLVSVSSTIYLHALKNLETVWIDDTRKHPLCSGAESVVLEQTSRSVLCRALCPEAKVRGVVYIDMQKRSYEPDSEHRMLFEFVTGLASEFLAAADTRSRLLDAERRIARLELLTGNEQEFITGDSSASKELLELIEKAAEHDVTVLVTGETGTGKEMVARALHLASERRDGPFVAVNCSALPRDLIEAELFGAEKGAFTGADTYRPGRFEMACEGTLFLDEVGDIPLEVQVKLLRVLQERTVTPLGGQREVPLDFRLVCATHVDLEKAVNDGRFRQDLFYRVNVFRLPLLALRQRREDILPLARHFLCELSRRFGKTLAGFSKEAEKLLTEHSWPGNIRELRNAIERAVVVERSSSIEASSLPLLSPLARASADLLDGIPDDYEEAHQAFDRLFLDQLLKRHGGKVAAAAKNAGLSRYAMYRRIEKAGLARDKDKS